MALISCSECGRSISDRASACPNCGAPNPQQAGGPASTQQDVSVAEPGSTVCPFSGHHIPAGATVCACGAYYGYKGGVLTDEKFGFLVKLLGACAVLFLLGYVLEWDLGLLLGGAGALIFGVVFFATVLPVKLQGKKWWRAM